MEIKTLQDFFAQAVPCIATFDQWSVAYSPLATADHLCYKCGDHAEFEYLRSLFERDSAFMFQSIISGRPIAIIKFSSPLQTNLGEIWFLELSDQKPDGSQKSGFDHIEIYPTTGSVEDLVKDLETKGFTLEKTERPHHTTYDGKIAGDFMVRLEPEALMEKIKLEEIA